MRIEKIVFAAIVMAAILSGCGKIEKAPVMDTDAEQKTERQS